MPEELEHDRAGLEESLADSRQVVDRLQYNAWRLLSGQELEHPDTVRSELAALTSEHLRELAEQALPTVLAQLPEGCAASLDGLPDRTDDVDRDQPVNGRPFGRRLVSTAPPRLQVIAGDDGITLRLDESISTVLWEQVVGLVNAGREQQLWYEACLALLERAAAGECVGEGVAGGHGRGCGRR